MGRPLWAPRQTFRGAMEPDLRLALVPSAPAISAVHISLRWKVESRGSDA